MADDFRAITIRHRRESLSKDLAKIVRSHHMLRDPESWYGLHHAAVIECYEEVLAVLDKHLAKPAPDTVSAIGVLPPSPGENDG